MLECVEGGREKSLLGTGGVGERDCLGNSLVYLGKQFSNVRRANCVEKCQEEVREMGCDEII